MLCQSCSKNTATTHIKTIVNGEFTEYMLCPECAKKLGYLNLFDGFGVNVQNFLGSFFGESAEKKPLPGAKRCKGCGSSFADIVETGKVGCAACYNTFYDQMMPSIQRIHGNTTHTGKISISAGAKAKLESNLQKLKNQLKEMIEKQEFEKAAELRDQIKEIEEQVNDHE